VFSVYIKPMEAEVGALSGWIFFAHQVGAAMGAATAGWIFEWTGSYASAFMSGAGLTLAIREERVIARRTPSSAPAPATT
jgi:predicted MFS family arabinose efflux permease